MANPATSIIFPDTNLTGATNVVRVTSENSPSWDVSTTDSDNIGDIYPMISGSPPDGSTGMDLMIRRAGGLYEDAEWLWKPASSAETCWAGLDELTYLTRSHDPFSDVLDTRNVLAGIYAKNLGKIFLYLVLESAPSTLYIRYRDAGSDPMTWTSTTASLGSIIQTDQNLGGAEVLEMSDGTLRLLAIVSLGSGAGYDINVFGSVDGLSWSLIARNVLSRAGYPGLTIRSMKAARSGEWIRMVVMSGSYTETFISSDRCASWVMAETPTSGTWAPVTSNAQNKDAYGFSALIGLDDTSGTFLFFNNNSGSEPYLWSARADESWVDVGSLPSGGGPFLRITAARTPTHLYMVGERNDMAGGWSMWIAPIEEVLDTTKYVSAGGASGGYAQSTSLFKQYLSAPFKAFEVDGGFAVLYGLSNPASSGDSYARGGLVYGAMWTTHSLYRNEVLSSSTIEMLSLQWESTHGYPNGNASAGNPFKNTRFTNGTISESWVPDGLTLNKGSGAATTSAIYYAYNTGATPGVTWGYGGAYIGWTVKNTLGQNGLGYDRCAVRIKTMGASAGQSMDFSVQHKASRIIVYDNAANQAVLTLSGLNLTEHFTTVRLSVKGSGSSYYVNARACSVQSYHSDEWVSGTSEALAVNAAGVTSQWLAWGILTGPPDGVADSSTWRMFEMDNEATCNMIGFDNPANMRGATCGARGYAAYHSLVQWAGGSGFEGDRWNVPVRHQYPIENIFQSSPSVCWRSTDIQDQTIVLDPDPDYHKKMLEHTGVGLFGTNFPSCTIVYGTTDTPFTSPVASHNIDAYMGAAMSVSAVAPGYFEVTPPAGGYWDMKYQGKYIHVQTGFLRNQCFKVQKNIGTRIHLAGVTTSIIGVAGLTVGDTVRFYDTQMITTFARNSSSYMGISITGMTTHEGYYQIGTLVAGATFDFSDVEMNWKRSEDEIENVEQSTGLDGRRTAVENSPPRRTFSGTIVGDSVGMRLRLRDFMRHNQMSARPVVFVHNADSPNDGLSMLARMTGSIKRQNVGYVKVGSTRILAGDQVVTFEEEL